MSDPDRLVSVVIPAYNAASTLEAAIASVRRQAYSPIEMRLVDDGSTDATPEIIRRLAGPDLHVSRQPNRGVSAARNAGIRAARGDLVAFLDADDEWLPGKLARQVEFLSRHPEVGLLYTLIERVDAGGRPIGVPRSKPGRDDYPHLFHSNRIPTSSVVARRRLLLRAGLFDETLRVTQDYDMWLRIAALGPFAGIPEPLARYRYRGGISRDVEAVYQDHLKIIEQAPMRPETGVDDRARERARALYQYRLGRIYARQRRWDDAARMFGGVLQRPLRYGLRRRGPADHRVRLWRSLRYFLLCEARASLSPGPRPRTTA